MLDSELVELVLQLKNRIEYLENENIETTNTLYELFVKIDELTNERTIK